MKLWYAQGRSLCEINRKDDDSLLCLNVLTLHPIIGACVNCSSSYNLEWLFPDFRPSLANLYSFYHPSTPLDPFVYGIWSGQPSKFPLQCEESSGFVCSASIGYMIGGWRCRMLAYCVERPMRPLLFFSSTALTTRHFGIHSHVERWMLQQGEVGVRNTMMTSTLGT